MEEMTELEDIAREKSAGMSLLVERDNEIRGILNGTVLASTVRLLLFHKVQKFRINSFCCRRGRSYGQETRRGRGRLCSPSSTLVNSAHQLTFLRRMILILTHMVYQRHLWNHVSIIAV